MLNGQLFSFTVKNDILLAYNNLIKLVFFPRFLSITYIGVFCAAYVIWLMFTTSLMSSVLLCFFVCLANIVLYLCFHWQQLPCTVSHVLLSVNFTVIDRFQYLRYVCKLPLEFETVKYNVNKMPYFCYHHSKVKVITAASKISKQFTGQFC